ncbi:MAG: glycosyltransferase [Croceivirga sp.]
MSNSKRVLIAPLNWGLGHATRCIPIIQALVLHGFEPIIASDGVALKLLRKEFPQLQSFALPSYDIKYAEKGKHFKLKMIWDSPKVLKTIAKERKATKRLVKAHQIEAIISDNRLGVRYKKVPSVFITHQLNVLSGNTTWFSSKAHREVIKKFDVCWVPDVAGKPNLTGKLGHLKKAAFHIEYLGPLSRFQKEALPIKYDVMILLSGPEPQRGMLAKQLLKELKQFRGNVLFVKGKIEAEKCIETLHFKNAKVYVHNYMQSQELQTAINSSEIILCRSGYTTIMDLAKLEKKAFFIPTPGQYEQEYLAQRLHKKGIVPFSTQDKFILNDLNSVQEYSGLASFKQTIDYKRLFLILSSVKENSEPTSTSLST